MTVCRSIKLGGMLGLSSSGVELQRGVAAAIRGPQAARIPGLGVYPEPDSADAVNAAIAAFIEQAEKVKAAVQRWNNRLYALAAAAGPIDSGSVAQSIDDWHTQAVAWMNSEDDVVSKIKLQALGGTLTAEGVFAFLADFQKNDPGLYAATFAVEPYQTVEIIVGDWAASAEGLIRLAQQRARAYRDTSLEAELADALAVLPGILRDAGNAVVDTAVAAAKKTLKASGEVVNTAIWETLKPLLFAGTGIALLSIILAKGGVGINIPGITHIGEKT